MRIKHALIAVGIARTKPFGLKEAIHSKHRINRLRLLHLLES